MPILPRAAKQFYHKTIPVVFPFRNGHKTVGVGSGASLIYFDHYPILELRQISLGGQNGQVLDVVGAGIPREHKSKFVV